VVGAVGVAAGVDPVAAAAAAAAAAGGGPGGGGGGGGGGGKNLSAPATLVGSKSWSCPFPPEADAEGKDNATVQLIVTVGVDGSPEKVAIVSDPGTGFGRAARACALGRRYKAGLDKDGNATRTTTAPITVRFTR
jgi:protein TonB